jgi:acyl-CoA synthetase (AMP-forming)/AMP-acid ligase II
MVLNVADLVEHAVDIVPDRLAVVCGDRRSTYAELDARANRLAHHLAQQGVEPGQHVGVYATNAMETVESLLAIYKIRAVAVNVNYRYTENELRYVVDNADAVALIHQRALSPRVANVLPDLPKVRHVVVAEDGSDPDDGVAEGYGAVRYEEALAAQSPERDFPERDPGDLYLLYTGGTTGRPKGVMWRHEDVWRALGGGIDFVTGEPVPDEWHQSRTGSQFHMVRMTMAPLMHGQAQWALLGSLFVGNTVVLMPKFDAHEVWRAIEQEKVNVVAFIGDAMARPLLEAYRAGNYDASTIFSLSNTAALLSPSVKQELLEAFPNAMLTDAIGSSEAGFAGIGVVSKDGMETRGPRVNPHKDAIVIDENGRKLEPGSGVVGRIARGGHVPLGYYKDPEKTAALFVEIDGKRYTVPGDAAIWEADGTITLLGRGDMCINSGGEKIFPEEVEGALKAHPGVFDVLVVGIPDERLGSRVGAVVQWREGHEPDSAALDAWARQTLAGYKVPRSYWWVKQVQRLPTGKPNYPWARTFATDHGPSETVTVTAGTIHPATGDAPTAATT